jgi:predicted nuclease of predicted toxin-antitoxin system
VPSFLLDENISPRIGKHLALVHGLDVLAFHKVARYGIPDEDVRGIARQLGRVLITLDSDFKALANLFGPTPPGIIWLHPTTGLRTLEGEKQILDRFFEHDAARLDLDNSIVEVGDFESVILYTKR